MRRGAALTAIPGAYQDAPPVKVAYASPLPPQRSGIADYSAELVPHLARHCEIGLYADPGVCPRGAGLEMPVSDIGGLGRRLARGEHAVAVYPLGNNADFHAAIYRTLLEHLAWCSSTSTCSTT